MLRREMQNEKPLPFFPIKLKFKFRPYDIKGQLKLRLNKKTFGEKEGPASMQAIILGNSTVNTLFPVFVVLKAAVGCVLVGLA